MRIFLSPACCGSADSRGSDDKPAASDKPRRHSAIGGNPLLSRHSLRWALTRLVSRLTATIGVGIPCSPTRVTSLSRRLSRSSRIVATAPVTSPDVSRMSSRIAARARGIFRRSKSSAGTKAQAGSSSRRTINTVPMFSTSSRWSDYWRRSRSASTSRDRVRWAAVMSDSGMNRLPARARVRPLRTSLFTPFCSLSMIRPSAH